MLRMGSGNPRVQGFTCGSTFSAGLVAVVLTGGPGPGALTSTEAGTGLLPIVEGIVVEPPPVRAAGADTLRLIPPRLFERRILFSTEYLGRMLDGAPRAGAGALGEAAARDARVTEYAGRYDISRELAGVIIESALQEGLDPELGFRLVRAESLFSPAARGPSGALGLTQLMPSTARAIDRTLRTDAQILDPKTNLRTGFRYLRRMIDRYDGDVRLALLAYNRGETAVDRALRSGRDPENGYSRKVLGTGSNRYAGGGLVR